MNLSKFLEDKKVGFWFSIATSLVLLLSGILYLAIIPSLAEYVNFALKTVSKPMITVVGVLPIIGAVAIIALLVLKQHKVIGYTGFGVSLVSFLLFIYVSYRYVFEWILQIEIQSLYPSFIIVAIIFVVSLVLSIVNVFLKQVKEVEEVTNE